MNHLVVVVYYVCCFELRAITELLGLPGSRDIEMNLTSYWPDQSQ